MSQGTYSPTRHIGERYGKLVVQRRRGEIATCRCDCGATCQRNYYWMGRSAKTGKVPQCDECAKTFRANRITQAYRAKKPISSPHQCLDCAGLPWRVRGRRCKSCGSARGKERERSVEEFTDARKAVDW